MEARIRAIDFMSTKLATASKDMTLIDAVKKMNKYRIGSLPVVDKKGKLVGILTERDIMKRAIARRKNPKTILVRNIMTKKPVLAHKFEDMNTIAKRMRDRDVSRIPILDGDRLVGIVTNKDILQQSPEVLNLLLEQASINPSGLKEPTAFGKCGACGEAGSLIFHPNHKKFLCDLCIKRV